MTLLSSIKGYNCTLIITDKFIKRITIMLEKDTWNAEEWVRLMLTSLTDWGISKAIISDWDLKFMSDLWKAIFKSMRTRILMSTAYHSQTDEQSERMNQSVKIALRYYMIENSEGDWVSFLSFLQVKMNNAVNASTDWSSNEILLKHKMNDLIMLLSIMNATEVEKKRSWHQREAEDSITFVNVNMKIQYDQSHKLLTLKEGDWVFIKLHKGYKVQGVNRKLGQQCVEPFQIIKRIRKLVYRVELPESWKIHNIISVIMLKSALPENDSYDQIESQHTDSVKTEGTEGNDQVYEIERVVDKRSWQYEWSASKIEYLVKWKGWGSEWNSWMLITELGNAHELIEDYNQSTVNHSQ